MKHHNKTNRWF